MNGTQKFTTYLQKAKQEAAKSLLGPNLLANVVAVGIGKKVVGRSPTPVDCVRIYVIYKEPDTNKLRPADLVPSNFLGVPTDVIAIGRLGRTGRPPAVRLNPTSQPGSPIRVKTMAANVNSGVTGTLGAVVEDNSGTRYILSCNHILAVNGRVSEDPDAGIVSAEFVGNEPTIAKPGIFVRLRRNGSNPADCALAEIKDSKTVLTTFPVDIKLNSSDPISPARDMKVTKVGAATGRTDGTIVDIDADLFVDYSFGTFRFAEQIVIDGGRGDVEFATEGDSGSIVVDKKTKQPTAMIFAASGRFAVACPLSEVLNLLGEQMKKSLKLISQTD